ncbi:DNA polymerase III subunit gamma/tau [Patescibacteria group bacterium]
MSLALYRKYRPQKWSDLTNQNHIKVTLQNEIETGKLAHAFIFTGPRGVGKTTTARLLAKSINCLDRKEKSSEPCTKCEACLELIQGNDLDILEIDAASHTGVDNVRENVINNARFTPVKRKYKVFIIDEVHMLSISAFNALLKILEEPPAHAVFILATTEIHKVPATIISRCQRFDFKKLNTQDLIERLNWICQQEGVRVSKKILTDIARYSEGCLRDAESLLGQALSLGDKEVSDEEASLIIPNSNYNLVLQLVSNLEFKNIEESIGLINKLVEDGVDLAQFADELIEFLRKVILAKLSAGLKDFSFDLDQEMEKAIIDLSQKFTVNDLLQLINLFSIKKSEIKTAAIPQLPLEIAIIEYCQTAIKQDQADHDDDSEDQNKSGPEPISKKTNKQNKSGASNTTLKNNNLPPKQVKNIKITLAEIKDKWHNFLIKLQDYNASLVFILKIAEPMELTGNILKIGFKYAFHEQRVNQAKIKESVESVLGDFYKEKIAIATCLLADDYQSDFIDQQTSKDEVELVKEIPATENGEQEELIENLVQTFGGKIVE